MGTYTATIQSILLNVDGNIKEINNTPVTINAYSRHDALLTALDMGQAYARGQNRMKCKYSIFFRIIDMIEKK